MTMAEIINMNVPENKITHEIMDCFLKVHKAMGPGLLESIYEECLCYELQKRNMSFSRQISLPILYDGISLKNSLRLDLVVENKVVLELKSIEKILPIHEAQILSYLKLSKLPIGFLVNFNVPLIKNGVKRFVNNFGENSATSASPR
jgi:GxxExxY protein